MSAKYGGSLNCQKNEFCAVDMIEIDPRSYLEVKDKKHRYGKNLRQYYKEWDKILSPEDSRDVQSFFDWLDDPNCLEVKLFSPPT